MIMLLWTAPPQVFQVEEEEEGTSMTIALVEAAFRSLLPHIYQVEAEDILMIMPQVGAATLSLPPSPLVDPVEHSMMPAQLQSHQRQVLKEVLAFRFAYE